MADEKIPMTYTPPLRDPKAAPVRINLLSDTQTRPTPAMREAIARAEVGDEQIGDLIEVKEASKQLTHVLEAVQLPERDVPDFLDVDHSKMTAKFTRIPALSDVPFAVQMEPHLIVEFYSR